MKHQPASFDSVRECSTEELRMHLRSFVRSFVTSEYRSRALHILVEKPEKASNELRKLVRHLDGMRCTELKGYKGFPASLEKSLGDGRGIYFDGLGRCLKVTAAQAATLAYENDSDAIFSLMPGKIALYFNHDSGVWFCRKT